jgi:hypothetical protein
MSQTLNYFAELALAFLITESQVSGKSNLEGHADELLF